MESTAKAAREYEKMLYRLYEELSSDIGATTSLHKELVGLSGQRYEIDLCIEFAVAGVQFLTVLEAKHYERKIVSTRPDTVAGPGSYRGEA